MDDVTRERLLNLLPPERQLVIRQELALLKSLNLPTMSDASLGELYDAVGDEISRRDKLAQ